MNPVLTQTHLIQQTFHTLFHLSDIHIRNDQDRKEEFTTQFNRTFSMIENHPKFNKDTSIIIVTGDILDNGLRNSAISIDLLRILIDGLTRICPTIIIPGNHDYKKDVGYSKIDTLSAIFNHSIKNRPRLFYLKESGIYHFGTNLVFGHSSVDDKRFIRAEEIETEKLKIGLFHGMVDDTDSTKKHLDYEYTYKDFQGYDKVLLGDIHRCYPVRDNIWYAGSLVQKSWSEDRHLHGGLLVWDVSSKNNIQPQYLQIENDHAFLTLKIVNGEIEGEFKSPDTNTLSSLNKVVRFDPKTLPKISSLKFKCDHQTTSSQIDNLCEKLGKFTIIKSRRQESDLISLEKDINQSNLDTLPTMDNYLDYKYPNEKKQLLNLDNKYRNNHSLNDSLENEIGKWCPIHLEMTNMFSYSNTHTIDFNRLPQKDIISIHGKNGSGKSKILETILIAIYGTSPKELNHIIHLAAKKGETKITIQLHDDLYRIERRFMKGKKSIPSPIIYKNNELYSASSKGDNEIYLKKLFGEKDDLLTTHISKQGTHEDFIKKKPKEQLDLLTKVFNTDIYSYIHKRVKEDIKLVKTEFNTIDKNLKEVTKTFIEPNTIQNTLLEIETNKRGLQLQSLELKEKLKISSTHHGHKKLLEREIREIEGDIKKLPRPDPNTPLQLQKVLEDINQKYKNIYPITDHSAEEEIKTLKFKLKNLEESILKETKQRLEIEKDKTDLSNLQESLKSLIPLKWTYPKLENYPQIKVIETIEELTNTIKELGEIDHPETLETRNREYLSVLEKQKGLQQKKSDIEKDLESYRQRLKEDSYRYNHYCYQCQFNKDINRIPYLETKIKECQELLTENGDTLKFHQEYVTNHKDIPNLYQKSIILKETKTKIEHYHLYREYLKHRDYLEKKEEIEKNINRLENKINHHRLEKGLEIEKTTIECRLKELSLLSQHLETNRILERDILQLQTRENRLREDKTILDKLKHLEKTLSKKRDEYQDIPETDYPELEKEEKRLNLEINGLELERGRKESLLEQMTQNAMKIQTLTLERDEKESRKKLLDLYKQITIDFPLYINKKGIETLKNKINFYLRNMTDNFTVDIIYQDLDKKPNLQLVKIDKEKQFQIPILDYCSGFETFIISICLRISLANITRFRSIDILMIDEGFGVFDVQNIKLLPNMLDSLKKMFRHIFIITHIEDLQTEIRHKMKIVKDTDGSRIIY